MKMTMNRFVFFLLTGASFCLSLRAHAQESDVVDMASVLVVYDDPVEVNDVDLIKSKGGFVEQAYSLVNAVLARVPSDVVDELMEQPNVRSVESDGKIHVLDAELDNTWGVKHIGVGGLHQSGSKGSGIKVAVLDSGIDYNHPDLSARYKGGYDFVNNDNDPIDDHGHGTHVAGTIAASDNNSGVVGVAPEVELYALKVLAADGSGSFSSVIAALEWAVDHNIQVTNSSFGSSEDPGLAVQEAYDNAFASGMFHVSAAGNSGDCSGVGDNVFYPARYDSVVAVASVRSTNIRPCSSATGSAVELSAPGVSINSTKRNGGYEMRSGTSMASPHVSGLVALIMGAGIPDYNDDSFSDRNDVRAILQNSVIDLGSSGRDSLYGYGLIDAPRAFILVDGLTVEDPQSTDIQSAVNNGYVQVTGTISDASQALFRIPFSLTSDNAQATFPRNVRIMKTGGGNFDFSSLGIEDITQSIKDQRYGETIEGAIRIGVVGAGLTFSNPVTVSIPVSNRHNGQSLQVTSKSQGETKWSNETTCSVLNGLCTFQSTHATDFSAGPGTLYVREHAQINLDINSTISLACDPIVTMNALVGTGRSTIDDNNQADCTVTTNNSSGYKMQWQASVDDMLNATSDHFTAYSPSASTTPETWSIPNTTSAWGAKLAATSEGYNGGNGGSGYTYPGTGWGTGDSYTNGKFLNVASATPFQIMQKSTETDVDGEIQSLMFAAEIGADKLQPTGTYSVSATITATTL